MTAKTANLISELQGLTAEELREVQLHVSVLAPTDLSADEELVHDLTNQLLRSVARAKPVHKYRLSPKGRASLRRATKALVAAAEDFRPADRPEFRKAVAVLLRLVAKQSPRVAYSPILNHAGADGGSRLSEIVEAELPGYRESGLLPLLLARTREDYGYDES